MDEDPKKKSRGAADGTFRVYLMVLDAGRVRHSDDLIHWSAPFEVLPADWRSVRFLQTRDRRVWAVSYDASTEEQLYTSRDALLGYYVRGGKKYKKLFDVLVTSSADGKVWASRQKVVTHGEPSQLWAFPLTETHVAIAVLYNGRFLRWLVSTRPDRFERVNTPIEHLYRRAAQFLVEDQQVVCLRNVDGRQGGRRTLALKSKALYDALTKGRPQTSPELFQFHSRVPALDRPRVETPTTGEEAPPRLWILPFTHAGEDPKEVATGVAIGELLTVLISHSTTAEVVDCEHLDRVLQEQKLSQDGLLSAEVRIRVGKLLGATVLVSGSFVEQKDEFMVTAHATDILSSRVLTSHRESGDGEDLAGLLNRLQQALVKDLRASLPTAWSGRTDSSPTESLFFLGGLDHYHAGRYHHALAEFFKASREKQLEGVSRLWMAKTYMAQEDYSHAFLELRKLQLQGTPSLKPHVGKTLAGHLDRCADEMSEDQRQLCEEVSRAVAK